MKVISWNINGYKSTNNKNMFNQIIELNPDIVCLQEIKINENMILKDGYNTYYNFADKKGYSGVAVLTKNKPINVINKIGCERFDSEGRFLCLEYDDFILINLYIPHGGRNKENIDYKLAAINYIIKFLKDINNDKNVIMCGDFNIAHTELDVLRYKDNYNNIMFTEEERLQIDRLLDLGFVDSFRVISNSSDTFSWWANAFNCRSRNIGWRIDYIFISSKLVKEMKIVQYLRDYYGSDHCPVMIDMNNINSTF